MSAEMDELRRAVVELDEMVRAVALDQPVLYSRSVAAMRGPHPGLEAVRRRMGLASAVRVAVEASDHDRGERHRP